MPQVLDSLVDVVGIADGLADAITTNPVLRVGTILLHPFNLSVFGLSFTFKLLIKCIIEKHEKC